MQFSIGSPIRTSGLTSLARALFLSLCVHAALIGVVWQFSSTRQQQPVQRMLDLELTPRASATAVSATVPQTPGEMPRDNSALRPKTHSDQLVRTTAGATQAQPVSAARAIAESISSNVSEDTPPMPETARSAPQDSVAIDLRILEWLAQYRTYPLAARRARIEGVVQLRVTLMPDGTLVGARIERSSGHAILDRAALELLSRAARLPDTFGNAREGQIELQLPIVYRMRT
jgi:protein TonB